jgi:short-subunit dehydrogenase
MELHRKYPQIHVSVVMPGIVDTPFHEIATPPLPARAGEMLWGSKVESADDVATRIISLIDNPVAELYTNPEAYRMVEAYFRDVGAFEDDLGKRQMRSS